MKRTHHVLVVPGLGGGNVRLRKLIISWEKYGFIPRVYDIRWKDKNLDFPGVLQRLTGIIDDLYEKGYLVSLIGISAGGSTVLNAFYERPEKIHKVVNISGRLRRGKRVIPTLEFAARLSPAFKESVLLFENREPLMTDEQRKKVLTVRAMFDEVVPVSTTTLRGAKNIRVTAIEHMISIAAAMTIYVGPVIEFLNEDTDD